MATAYPDQAPRCVVMSTRTTFVSMWLQDAFASKSCIYIPWASTVDRITYHLWVLIQYILIFETSPKSQQNSTNHFLLGIYQSTLIPNDSSSRMNQQNRSCMPMREFWGFSMPITPPAHITRTIKITLLSKNADEGRTKMEFISWVEGQNQNCNQIAENYTGSKSLTKLPRKKFVWFSHWRYIFIPFRNQNVPGPSCSIDGNEGWTANCKDSHQVVELWSPDQLYS